MNAGGYRLVSRGWLTGKDSEILYSDMKEGNELADWGVANKYNSRSRFKEIYRIFSILATCSQYNSNWIKILRELIIMLCHSLTTKLKYD